MILFFDREIYKQNILLAWRCNKKKNSTDVVKSLRSVLSREGEGFEIITTKDLDDYEDSDDSFLNSFLNFLTTFPLDEKPHLYIHQSIN